MTPLRPLLPAALLAALLACKAYQPVSAPAEQPRASTFPHSKHGGFDCVDCHTGIPKSTRLGETALPGAAKCQECHEADAAYTPPPAREAREYAITFDHAGHLARIKTQEINDTCKTCHGDELLPEPGPARSTVPPMQVCTACHQHEQEVAEARCQPCHVSLRRYPLKPIQALAGLSHQGNWVREHGRVTKGTAATCAQCHDQTYCANCHANATVPFRPEIEFPEKVQADFIHRGDYVSRHHIEAAADPASCRKCHGSNFCDSCHTVQDRSHRNTLAGAVARNPHPQGWAFRGSGQFHGDAARQNLVTCAGCHDQAGAANVCTTCHNSRGPGAAGIGGNPHPAGYGDKHPRSDIRNTPMCQACHTNG